MPITNKILIDEMDDGMDEKLNSLGYDAYSIKNYVPKEKNYTLIILLSTMPKKIT